MSADAPVIAVARPDAPPEPRSTAWWGMVLLIATEATIFALLFAAYFYLRFKTVAPWPPDSIADPKIVGPLVATIVLVCSSIPLTLAGRAARGIRPAAARIALLAGVALGVAFLILQYRLVDESLDTFGPRRDAYGSIFYALIGLHAGHAVAGLLLALWAMLRSLRFDRTAVVTVGVTALYWHFVNAVAVVVFLTLYLSPRV